MLHEACTIIRGMRKARLSLRSDGVTAEELERAKEHVKGPHGVLGLQSTPPARMSRISRLDAVRRPVLSLDEMIARVDEKESGRPR